MSKFKLPEKPELIQMLAMFLEEPPRVGDPSSDNGSVSHIATYCNDSGEPVALCNCDIELASSLGAILTMIPPAAAQDMAQENELTEMASDNLYEFMNMFSSLFMDNATDHLKLTTVSAAGSDQMPNLSGETAESAYELSMGPYGVGTIRFVAKTG